MSLSIYAAERQSAALRSVDGSAQRTATTAREGTTDDLLPCFWTDLCWKIPV
jgi:hypothetical protein